jgi:hypothetical protein
VFCFCGDLQSGHCPLTPAKRDSCVYTKVSIIDSFQSRTFRKHYRANSGLQRMLIFRPTAEFDRRPMQGGSHASTF